MRKPLKDVAIASPNSIPLAARFQTSSIEAPALRFAEPPEVSHHPCRLTVWRNADPHQQGCFDPVGTTRPKVDPKRSSKLGELNDSTHPLEVANPLHFA
jgi:hypothetical protein